MERLLNNDPVEVLSFYFPNPESSIFLKKFKEDVFLIELDKKKYVIKEYPSVFTPERLKFFEELQNFTNERMKISPYIMTTLDKSLNVQLGGFGYDLTEFVRNDILDKNNVENIEKFFFDIGFFVGNLHNTFSEFQNFTRPMINSLLNIDSDSPNHMVNLLKDYEKAGVEDSWAQIVKAKIAVADDYLSIMHSFITLPQKIVHGDLYLKNILLDKDQKIVGLIDFAHAGIFFRCYEVMRSMIQTNRFFQNVDVDPLYLKSFLRGYLSKCDLDDSELEKMLDLYIYIQASDISFLDTETLRIGNVGILSYAKYRFNNLISLHRNHRQLKKSIDEFKS